MSENFDRAAITARVKEEIAEQARAAILTRLPPLSDALAVRLSSDPVERDRVMQMFGDPELFFAWLKTQGRGDEE